MIGLMLKGRCRLPKAVGSVVSAPQENTIRPI